MWLCKCECGTEKNYRGSHLRSGHTKSCGCLNKYPFGIANMRRVMNRYEENAQIKGLEYNLTEKQFAEITQRNCHYCGARPNNITKSARLNGGYKYNGIDRIDNDKGYTIDNVVPCCKTCNSAKGILTTQEFKNWVIKIYNNMMGK